MFTLTKAYQAVFGDHVVELDSAHRREQGIGASSRAAYKSAHGALRLYERYYAEISSWDWQSIKAEALANPDSDLVNPCGMLGDSDPTCGYAYLGDVFSLMPSGKYYTAWACSNVSDYESTMDESFYAALESIAESHGLWIESGEGDPCDLFAVCSLD